MNKDNKENKKAEWVARLRKIKKIHDLQIALDESLELQAHYAKLLYTHDGGERIVFKNVAEWVARLRKIKKIKA